MGGLKSQHAALMKRHVGYFLDGTAVIQRSTPSVSGAGYPSDSFAAVGTVTCRLLPMSKSVAETTIAMQEKGRSYYTLVVPDTADLRDGDRVVSGGITFEVVQIDTQRTDKTDKQALLAMFGNG